MTILLFLNEKSHDGVGDDDRRTDRENAGDLLTDFVRLLVEIRKQRRDVALVSAMPIREIRFGGDYVFARWAGDHRNREHLRLLKAVMNRAPFQDIGPLSADGLVSYLLDEQEVDGLGYAHAFGGLAVSMMTAERWNAAEIDVVRRELVEHDDSGLYLVDRTTTVRHAATRQHVNSHGSWLAGAGLRQLHTPSHLWNARADLFPHLAFLARVESDLLALGPVHLRQVSDRLLELEKAMSSWNPRITAAPAWMSKVAPEAEQRRLLCVFEDLDGTRRSFDLHARFTPGAGRIHFRTEYAARRIIVAYIGTKIEHRRTG
ncbi:conserved hypothetical protein [Frankia canadensis]|uniref:Uncharacterized protein n=1 Tax=Frankia canadensis TaxID=1836972 RepID=A0A2I2KV47_9ACTN|nr:hypothetical protein [Frankia canadensis]SNQ49534.1 conserved hypothetical protein [Frankia canadensis]SOU56824.1 conserved hypothetical protein [Frankia canadensis]